MDALQKIPFLGGYMTMDAVNRGREAQQFQQAGQFATLQSSLQQQAQAQADAPIRSEILRAQLDEHRGKAAKLKRMEAMFADVQAGGADKMTPEQLEKIGQFLAMGEHPGAATILGIADKRRKEASDASTMGLLRSQTVTDAPAADEAEAVARINAGGGAPMSIGIGDNPNVIPRKEGGLFAPLMASGNKAIAMRAKLLQETMDKTQGRVDPQFFIKQADGLASQNASFEERQAGRQFNVDNRPPPAPKSDPLKAVIGPDGKPTLVPQSKAEGMTPFSPSIAGGADMRPDTLKFLAQQYLTGDRQAVAGFARSATARIAIQNAIVDEAVAQGMTPQQVAGQIADFAGTMAGSRTVGQRAANISLAATEAQEMLGIVKETSDDFARTDFVPWNMALKAYETNTGDPKIARFGASVNALVNVYARAINPTGVPTVSDKEHARAVLNTVQSPAQVDAVLEIIRRELEIAKKAPQAVQDAARSRVAGPRPTGPTSDPASVESAVTAAGYAYEPDKYDYRVGAGGRVQRKAK
jgi:hypothetical protein